MSNTLNWVITLCIAGHANMMLAIATKNKMCLWWGFGCFVGAVMVLGTLRT